MLKRDVPGNGNRANKKLVSLIRVVTVESPSYLKVDKYNRKNLPPLFFDITACCMRLIQDHEISCSCEYGTFQGVPLRYR